MVGIQKFQKEFKTWLGPQPEEAARIAAQMSGYSVAYVRWVAGLRGNSPWPGSRRFVRKMRKLGCHSCPWRNRSPEELSRAFETREILFDPTAKTDAGRLSNIVDTCAEAGGM